MTKYELTFLLDGEEELKPIASLLESLSGKIIEEKKWGKMSLAYPIKKKSSLDFFTWTIEIDKENVTELKTKLNFNEKLIRYLLLVQE